MFPSCWTCLGRRNGADELMWQAHLKPHNSSGDISIAVVQANSRLEDQCQIFTSPSATYIGVFDGHGGPEASRFVSRHLFLYLHKFAKEQGGLSDEVIKMAFNNTEEEFIHIVRQTLPVSPQIASVGSCCLVGTISNNELYVANLGDSRAVLGLKGYDGESNTVVAERLTTDHNVSSENIRREIKALHPDDSAILVYSCGAWRIKGIIQVSRSIGDAYLKNPDFNKDPIFRQYGNHVPLMRPLLTAEPSIVHRKIRPHDLFLIFASDGLWEHLSDQAAVEIVFKNCRAGIAKRLVAAALQEAAKKREIQYNDLMKIEKGTRRHFHDDITVIVIYLDHSTKIRVGGGIGYITSPVDIFALNSDHHKLEKADANSFLMNQADWTTGGDNLLIYHRSSGPSLRTCMAGLRAGLASVRALCANVSVNGHYHSWGLFGLSEEHMSGPDPPPL